MFLQITLALLLVASFQLCQAHELSVDMEGTHLRKDKPPTQHLSLRSSIRKASPTERHLQSFNYSYSASYMAKFQYLRDPNCVGPAPVIRVFCRGPNIQVMGTSNASIVCSNSSVVNTDGWSFIECNNTCASDADCQDVYLVVDDHVFSNDGPFGDIVFQCAGDVINEVDAAVSFENSGNGGCANAPNKFTRNIHVLRLGVSCPTDSGDREYVFDDLYFECSPASGSSPGEGHPGDVNSCFEGQNCYGVECEVIFDILYINADGPPFFFNKCIESLVPIPPAPTPAPIDLTKPSLFLFSARFEAAWGLLFDPKLDSVLCSRNIPTVRITCSNGNLMFLNSTYETVSCRTVSRGIMECTDNNTANFVGQFTGVVYECSGPEKPTTMIEYPEANAFCDGNSQNTTVRHAVQLGVFCDVVDDGKGEFPFFGDLYFDCAYLSNQFDKLDEFGVTNYSNTLRYTCSESATFTSGSTAFLTQTLPKLAISTDLNWDNDDDTSCYKFVTTNATSSPSAPTTQAPVTSPPSEAPVTFLPSDAPSNMASPTSEPTSEPTPPTPLTTVPSNPAPDPTQPPVRSLPPKADTSSNNGSVVGAAVGAAVGVIAIAGIVACLVLRRKLAPDSSPTQAQRPHESAPVLFADDTTESRTGRNVETPYQHRAGVAAQHDPQSEPVSAEDDRFAAVAHLPAVLTRPVTPTVEYKDQVRSVYAVPMVNAVPVTMSSQHPTPPLDPSTLSDETRASRRSDPEGRRAIDRTSEHDEPATI